MASKRKRRVSVEIYQGADGRWHGYLTVGIRPDGRLDRRHRSGKTHGEVTEKIRQLEDELSAGRTAKPGRPPTLAEWLNHWLDNIVTDLRYATRERSYGWAIRRHITPGLGAHRIDHLEPEHVELFYRRLASQGLSPASVHAVHRTLRAALNEAVRRGKIPASPLAVVRAPRTEETEVVPLFVEEVRRILAVCDKRRNGTRWSVGLSLGLRQGETLGLRWHAEDTPGLDLDRGGAHVKRKAERRKWQHGCNDPVACARRRCRTKPCIRDVDSRCKRHQRPACPPLCTPGCTGHARACPQKTGGGIVFDDPKSMAGKRWVIFPPPMLDRLRTHRRHQATERLAAGSLWTDLGLVWCQPNGRPIDARADWAEWKAVLAEAGVRDARVHDGRHTAATLLLLQGVDARTVMDIMGWSEARMLTRYQHVVDELRREAARRVGELLWGEDSATATSAATRPSTRRRRRS